VNDKTADQVDAGRGSGDVSPLVCVHCRKKVTREDIAKGRAFERAGRVVCRECARKLLRHRAEDRKPGIDELLEEIQRDVAGIKRELFLDRFSVWNVLGGIAEAAAIAAAVAAVVTRSDPYWFIGLQLLALTLVIMGKR